MKNLIENKQDCHWLAHWPGLFTAAGIYSKEHSRARKGPAKTELVITQSDNQNLWIVPSLTCFCGAGDWLPLSCTPCLSLPWEFTALLQMWNSDEREWLWELWGQMCLMLDSLTATHLYKFQYFHIFVVYFGIAYIYAVNVLLFFPHFWFKGQVVTIQPELALNSLQVYYLNLLSIGIISLLYCAQPENVHFNVLNYRSQYP